MTDKIKHIAAGLGIALLIALPCWLETQNLFAGLWACISGIISGIIGGGVKEFTDNKHDGCEWNWKDFGCTAIGAVLAMVVIIAMHFAKG